MLLPAKASKKASTRTTDIKVVVEPANAKQLIVYSATYSFNSCGEQSHKDCVQRTNCRERVMIKDEVRFMAQAMPLRL